MGTGTYFVIMNRLAHENQKVGLACAMAIVLLVIIVICTVTQKLFFKYAFDDGTSDESKAAVKNGKPFMPIYAYDPRLVKVEDTYYIIWCQDFYGAAIGMAKTTDFKTFVRVENPFLPFNRNAVLFPRKINGNFVMLSRPSDSGHTPFGDIFLSESPDMTYWASTVMSWERAVSGGSL